MILDKVMYFATGDGANLSGEAYTPTFSNFKASRPVSSTALDLIFDAGHGNFDTVRLTIVSNTHKTVLQAISRAMNSDHPNIGIICDSDNSIFCNSNITDCVIYLGRSSSDFNAQNITGTAKVLVNTTGGNFDSLSLANVHGSTTADINLYYASQVGTDIATTGVYAARVGGYAATTSSQEVVIDNGAGDPSAGTSDMFLNEKVYKSDGTLFGTCTTFESTTSLTFSGGLSNAIADNDVLYTGARYHVLKSIQVPVRQTLILDRDDISFNGIDYSLYITLVAGSIDLITRQ